MDSLNFKEVIKNIDDIDDESVKAGVLCELAKGVVNSDLNNNEILERLNTIINIANSFKNERLKSVVIAQVSLDVASYLKMPCDENLYEEMIDSIKAEESFIKRIAHIKKRFINEFKDNNIENK